LRSVRIEESPFQISNLIFVVAKPQVLRSQK